LDRNAIKFSLIATASLKKTPIKRK
jgi:hypothetical protein